MRDSNRIDYYCDELAALWHKVPDWRFGQFMVNMAIAYRMKHNSDTFYVEDDDFFKFMNEYFKEIENES